MQERDASASVCDDIGTELEGVVATRYPGPLAGGDRLQPGEHDAGAHDPERLRASCAESAVERALGVGDDECVPERESVTPEPGPGALLRGDDDESGAGGLDLGQGLRDTAEVGAADVSAGVPREIHDGGVPEQVAVGDDVRVCVLELEGGKLIHPVSLPVILDITWTILIQTRAARVFKGTKPLQAWSLTMSRHTLRLRASAAILVAAVASFVLSVTLWFTGSHDQGIFVGLWVPSILSFGVLALQLVGDRNE